MKNREKKKKKKKGGSLWKRNKQNLCRPSVFLKMPRRCSRSERERQGFGVISYRFDKELWKGDARSSCVRRSL
jgi:hypothetical protein